MGPEPAFQGTDCAWPLGWVILGDKRRSFLFRREWRHLIALFVGALIQRGRSGS
jgi:hypothetical protein